jgi:two-component system chemotaxis sensor kinase CheA
MTVDEDDILREFLIESTDNLDQLDQDFVALEVDATATDRIAAIFRAIHTIKGTSGFLGLAKLEKLAHAGESVLSRLRDGTLTFTPAITSALLAMVDGVRSILASVEASGTEGPETYSEVIESLGSLIDEGPSPVAHVAHAPPPEQAQTQVVVAVPGDRPSVRPQAVVEASQTQHESRTAASDTSIRVDVGLLDKLMNLVGELVLARNQIIQFSGQTQDSLLQGTSQRLNLITTELQEGVMKTRMQPIGNVWHKFPRVVRDLAVTCGKQVRLEMIGAETDLDRTIIEAIKDPLTHLVRNSVDHGFETPEVRVARGKPAVGRLVLRAFHEGGQVNIEISDDGGGIDPAKLRQRAVDRTLITPERAARMSDRESLNLIFLPGFSTAAKVTSVSGRGVGMDVVKTNVEKIGGTVDVHSTVGHGTALKIKIPLTLAIIPALIVTSHTERFAIPQVNLLELVRLAPEQAATQVEHIHGAPVYRLRGNILPLVYLQRTLEFPSAPDSAGEPVNIVVLQADERQFGLVVDSVCDTEEIVVKPLGKELKGLSVFAGATIMGDGRVALILDVMGIAERANVISAARDRNMTDGAKKELSRERAKRTVLLFGVHGEERMAIPLSMVARLEEFPRSRVERSNGKHVVQYRGRILPLLDLSGAIGEDATAAPLQVIVYSEQGRSVGLVVEQILDVVEESVEDEHQLVASGLAVIAGRVTDLVNVRDLILASDPQFFDQLLAS